MALTHAQVAEMTQLRKAGCNRREIAAALDVTQYQVIKAWGELPEELQGHLSASYEKASVTQKARWADRVIEYDGEGQCKACGMFFDKVNLQGDSGSCVLCELQKMGWVIVC